MSSTDGAADYSKVYEHLVESDVDVIGLAAYALYKQDKRDWLVHWRQAQGTAPNPEHVRVFVSGSLTKGARERYREAARAILDAYALVAVETERPLIKEQAITERMEAAAGSVEASTRWHRQIPAGIAAALVYTALLILVAFALRYAGVDLLSVFERTG
jgi:hypothetical protein